MEKWWRIDRRASRYADGDGSIRITEETKGRVQERADRGKKLGRGGMNKMCKRGWINDGDTEGFLKREWRQYGYKFWKTYEGENLNGGIRSEQTTHCWTSVK